MGEDPKDSDEHQTSPPEGEVPTLEYRSRLRTDAPRKRPLLVEEIDWVEANEGLFRLAMFFAGFLYAAAVVACCWPWMLKNIMWAPMLILGVPGVALLRFRYWRWATLGIALAAGLGVLVLYAVGSTMQTMYRGF